MTSDAKESPVSVTAPALLALGTTVSGAQFNKYIKEAKIQLYKLTVESEIHNGFQFRTGLNIDTVRFNPTGCCCPGGIYFCEFSEIVKWLVYNDKVCIYYRPVTIPDSALVYIEEDKFKADQLVLGDRHRIWDDEKICEMAVRHQPFHLQYVLNQTDKLCELAIRGNAWAIQYVRKQTDALCELAVTVDPENHSRSALKFIQTPSDRICRLAVQTDGYALRYIKKQTPELCELAVQQCGYALCYVHEQTDRICELAVKDRGMALGHVKKQTDVICKLAVQQNGCPLKRPQSNRRNLRISSPAKCIRCPIHQQGQANRPHSSISLCTESSSGGILRVARDICCV
jgi:hypothetical protein